MLSPFNFRSAANPNRGQRALRSTLVITLVGLAMAPAAYAEPPTSIEINAFAGYAAKSATNELGNASDPGEVPGAGAGFGLRGGYAFTERLGAEGELRYVLSALRKSKETTNITTFRANAVFNLLTEGTFRPFGRVGLGLDSISSSSFNVTQPDDTDVHAFLGIGTRIAINDNLGVRLDFTASLVPARGDGLTVEPEAWVGVFYLLGGKVKDSDDDGIVDPIDKCRFDPEDRDGWQDEDGCPEADNDGDGLRDAADRCPDVAENINGVKDDDGCPDADKDGDGIDDSDDKCPAVAENKNGFEDSDGCPDDPDSDGDTIPDSRDNCPREKETVNNLDDEDGCPDQASDGDGDGIADTMDKCPRDPETKNGFADSDGCPDKLPEKLKKFSGVLAVQFDGASAQLLPKSLLLLDKLAEVLTTLADVKAELTGFADDAKVGQGQAGAVRYYLMSKGIAADRLSAIGAAVTDADKAKAKGPRIEIQFL